MVGVAGRKQRIELDIFLQAARLVVVHPLLVLDHTPLEIDGLLGDSAEQVAHAVRFKEQGAVESAGRHRLEIIRAVEPGRAVPVGGANAFEPAHEAARRVLGAIEHQMFEEVSEAGLALGLVLRSDVVPD